MMDIAKALQGCLLGTAVGDSIGLPTEGLSQRKQAALFGRVDSHRLIFGKGMVSDDTDHACITAQALALSAGDPKLFASSLARGLKSWLLSLPPGTGLATARAIAKLLIGIRPENSGVFSAGNGPAMRSAVIGVCFGADRKKLKELVRISTRITHTDPKAEYGAYAVALAAWHSANGICDPDRYLTELQNDISEDKFASELLSLVDVVVSSVKNGESTFDFVQRMQWGSGISGYIYRTVPAALHASFSYPTDLRSAIVEIIRCGGDTDTTAAIVGSIVGACNGLDGIPSDWLNGILDWPRGINWINNLTQQLAESVQESKPIKPAKLLYPFVLIRNLVMLVIVLLHGLRRLFPPY